MAYIGRRMPISKCSGQRVRDGQFIDFYEEINGSYDLQRANRYFRRKYHDQSITINNIEMSNLYYRMDKDKFMQLAEIVD